MSSTQLSKDLGVTQKTAWFMLQRIRTAFGLNRGKDKLTGTCEADETYIGGKEKNKHKNKRIFGTQGRSVKTKIPIVGILERDDELRANVVKNTISKKHLQKYVDEFVFRYNTRMEFGTERLNRFLRNISIQISYSDLVKV